MKRGTENKLKFKRLKARLKLDRWQVRGLLDTLWDITYDNAPAGDIGRLTNEDIATMIEWGGDPDALIEVLVETGWIDRDPRPAGFRLVIHDWSEHCETWHAGNMKKYGKTFSDRDLQAYLAKHPQSPKDTPKDAPKDTPDEGRPPGGPTSSLPLLSLPSHTQPSPTANLATSKVEIPESIRTPEVEELLGEFVQHRKAKRQPMTDVALNRLFVKLERWGVDRSIRALEHSLENGWTGVFEPGERETRAERTLTAAEQDRLWREEQVAKTRREMEEDRIRMERINRERAEAAKRNGT